MKSLRILNLVDGLLCSADPDVTPQILKSGLSIVMFHTARTTLFPGASVVSMIVWHWKRPDSHCVRSTCLRIFVLVVAATRSQMGKDYRGDVAVSATGKQCEPWADSFLAQQYFHTPEFAPEAGLVSNYCRNPMSINPALSSNPLDIR